MALKIGELYAILGLESKDFYKDLDKAEKGMTGMSATFFKAVTANKQFDKSLQGTKDTISALEKLIDKNKNSIADQEKKVAASTAAVSEAKDKLKQLADTTGDSTDEYKAQQKAVAKAESALASANAKHSEAITLQGKLEKSLVSANKELKAQSSYWSKLASKASSAGKFQQELGAKLSKNVTLPLVGLGTTALWAGVEFQSAFAGVEKTVDGTDKQMADLRQNIRGMAKDIPATTTELSAIAEAAGQLGIETDNVIGFTKVMADMKETTNLGDEGATEMARFANITGMAQTNFDRLGSSIVYLGNNYATTEAEIMSMALRLGAAGKQAHMSEADILGIAASLSSLGIESEAGGSAFSKVISSMQLASEVGGKDLNNFAKVAGMTGEQFAQTFKRDAPAALNAFITGLSSGGDSAIKILDDIGISEVRMRDALLRASGAGDLFADALKDSNRAWRDNNALTQEAEKRYKTAASRLKVLGNKAKDAAIDMGDQMIPYFEKGMDVVGGLVDKFSELSDGTKSTLLYTGAFAASLGPVTSVLGKANSGLKSTIGSLKTFGEAINKNGGGLKGFGSMLSQGLGPMGWFAIAAGVVAVTAAYVDYASGAKAAREATAALNKTADEWKNTQAKTIFDSGNDPFQSLRIDRSIFGSSPEMSKADIKELKSLDKEYEKLLRKKTKQDGTLNETDQSRLDEIRNKRYEIRMDYALGEVTGFEEIERSVEAEVARLKALGFTDKQINASVYGDAINAANEGNIQNMEVLNAKYAEQYALVQKIEDPIERAAAQAALDLQYQQERTEALKEYAETLLSLGGLSMGTEEMDKAKTDMNDLHSTLLQFAEGKIDATGLKDFADGLDEGELASYVGTLGQIQQMMDAGLLSEKDIAEVFPDFAGQEENLKSILGYLEKFSELEVDGSKPLESLNKMFNEALPEEISRVFGEVNASIGSVVLGDGVVLPDIPGLQGSIDLLTKGETMTWEGEKPTIEAVANHITDNIPEDERTLEEQALVNVMLNKDQLADGAWLQPWQNYLAATPPLEVPATISFTIPERDELMEEAANAATNSGSSWATNSVYEAVVELNVMAENEQDILGQLEGILVRDDMEAIALDIPVQLGIVENSTNPEEKAAAEERIKQYLKLFENASNYGKIGEDVSAGIAEGLNKYEFNTDASTLATTVDTALCEALETHSPSKLTEPIGDDVSGGIGVGMTSYNFATNASKTASNLNARLSLAFTAKYASWKARGAYAAAGVGKGLAEYDFSGDASTMSENLLKAIATALGINSPAKKLIPSGLWSGAGLGKGVAGYDFTSYAKQTANNLSGALGKVMGSTLAADKLFELAIRPSAALQNFARGLEEQTSISMAALRPQAAQKQAVVARFDLDYELLADAVSKRSVSISVGGRELSKATVNDNSRTIREHDYRVRKGYGGR